MFVHSTRLTEHWLQETCIPEDQLSDECSRLGNVYLRSAAVLSNTAVPESGLCAGGRFQLHLKCRGGGGCLAPRHSHHRHGPNSGVQLSMSANPVRFMADAKKTQILTCCILKSPWATEPVPHPLLKVLQEGACLVGTG